MTKSEIRRRIREKCVECAGSPQAVRRCEAEGVCRIHHLRMGRNQTIRDNDGKLSARFRKRQVVKAVRAECIECMGSRDLGKCTSPNCRLHPIPRLKREHREPVAEIMGWKIYPHRNHGYVAFKNMDGKRRIIAIGRDPGSARERIVAKTRCPSARDASNFHVRDPRRVTHGSG